jgi:hypothetical protein
MRRPRKNVLLKPKAAAHLMQKKEQRPKLLRRSKLNLDNYTKELQEIAALFIWGFSREF